MSNSMGPKDMVRAAQAEAGTVDDDRAAELHAEGACFVDVREPAEWSDGIIKGAVRIPRGTLEFKIGDAVEHHESKIVTYCAAGSRAALAAQTLQRMGYVTARAARSGFADLKSAGLPVAMPDD